MRFVALIAVLLLSACATPPGEKPADEKAPAAPLVIKQSSYDALPGWQDENFDNLRVTFSRSCEKIAKADPLKNFGPDPRFGVNKDWQDACQRFMELSSTHPLTYKAFFEQMFVPYSVQAGTEAEGLFTGYYEAALNGSLTRHDQYQTPLHARPDDLVMVNLGEFREELKGQRIAGRVKDGNLKPYETREEILAGKLPKAQEKIMVWVDDPADAFFLQVQGSGIVQLDNGKPLRLGYAGQNGHIYYAIGRELVKRGELTKDNVSMQAIRGWLETYPDQAAELMNTNKSYVFFRELTGDGPEGGQGVALTPERSLAIDRSLVPYGMPVWLDANAPGDDSGQQPHLRRMMITQDTGGAITGPVRGDFFWGYGAHAEENAGKMKSKGRYWFLLPATVKPQ
jgi:membrane-bound lytic murein transglycosylase A